MKNLILLAGLAFPIQLATASDAPSAISGFSGNVLETTNTAGYTYVQVDTGSQKVWAATTQFPVRQGDTVTVLGGMPMKNFHASRSIVISTLSISPVVSRLAARRLTPLRLCRPGIRP